MTKWIYGTREKSIVPWLLSGFSNGSEDLKWNNLQHWFDTCVILHGLCPNKFWNLLIWHTPYRDGIHLLGQWNRIPKCDVSVQTFKPHHVIYIAALRSGAKFQITSVNEDREFWSFTQCHTNLSLLFSTGSCQQEPAQNKSSVWRYLNLCHVEIIYNKEPIVCMWIFQIHVGCSEQSIKAHNFRKN